MTSRLVVKTVVLGLPKRDVVRAVAVVVLGLPKMVAEADVVILAKKVAMKNVTILPSLLHAPIVVSAVRMVVRIIVVIIAKILPLHLLVPVAVIVVIRDVRRIVTRLVERDVISHV